jgi:hypothetical protein
METKRSQHDVIELTDAELEAIYGGQDDSLEASSSQAIGSMLPVIPRTPGMPKMMKSPFPKMMKSPMPKMMKSPRPKPI